MKYRYKPSGVCSKEFNIDLEDDKINSIEIVGGCAGNALGISKLLEGMEIDEAIKKLKGIPCGSKTTSCPDQISKALQEFKNNNN